MGMDYVKFVEYAVWISVLALDRSELHKDVIKGSEILEVLHQLPGAKNYLFSLYNCQYAEFFQELGRVEQHLKADRYISLTTSITSGRSRSRPSPSCWSPTGVSPSATWRTPSV